MPNEAMEGTTRKIGRTTTKFSMGPAEHRTTGRTVTIGNSRPATTEEHRVDHSPFVRLELPGLRATTFLIDTGSEISIIKERQIVNPDFHKGEPITLRGITNNTTNTLYSIFIPFNDKCNKFQVVDDTSPILQDGILGADYLFDHNFSLSSNTFKIGNIIKRRNSSKDNCANRTVLVNFITGTGAITKVDANGQPILSQTLRDQIESVENFDDRLVFHMTSSSKTSDRIRRLKENTRLGHLTEGKEQIWDIISNYHDIFVLTGDPLPKSQILEHEIKTTDETPVHTKQYRYPPIHQDEIKRQVTDLLGKGIIKDSDSPYNSPLWIVPKKADASGKQKWRLVIDYRKLNEKTIKDSYPIPNIDEILDGLGNAKYFSAFDLTSSFHQVGVKENDIHKTAFSTKDGHFEFVRMPFGLKNAPPTFQRLMNRGLQGLVGNNCFVYVDDIIVFGRTLEEHNKNLKIIFERLRQCGLKLQPDKCEYLKPELEYLGHVISAEGVQPNPARIEKVKNYPVPRNSKEIKQFLGLCGYYRKFVKDFAKIAKPINQLLRKDKEFQWTSEQQTAFETLRDALITQPVLQYPNWNEPFILTTDASNHALGAVLSQGTIGRDRPTAYASRTLNNAESRYTTTEKELLAIVWATKHFHQYLYGRKFTIVTDHKPLVWLMNVKDPNSRLVRWRLKLLEYDYEIIYKQGKNNTNADALSRGRIRTIEQDLLNSELEYYTTLYTNNPPTSVENDEFIKGLVGRPNPTVTTKPVGPSILSQVKIHQGFLKELPTIVYTEVPPETTEKGKTYVSPHDTGKTKLDTFTKVLNGGDKINLIQDRNYLTEIAALLTKLNRDIDIHVSKPIPIDKKEIIQLAHDSLFGGHYAYDKTLQKIRKQHEWPNITRDVKTYIENCETCQRQKDTKRQTYIPQVTDIPSKPTDKVSLDLVGPLDETSRKNKYILVIQDYLTRYVMCEPLIDKSTAAIIQAFWASWLRIFGRPKEILTDNAKEFTSLEFSEFCDLMKSKHVLTSVYHPQSNGKNERSHIILKEYLRCYQTTENPWDLILPKAMLNYNCTINRSTGYTPFELQLGYEPNSILDEQDEYLTLRQQIDNLKLKHENKIIETIENLQFQQPSTSYSHLDPIYKGNLVLIRNYNAKSLEERWRGPFEVTQVTDSHSIKINEYGKPTVHHRTNVKLFKQPTQLDTGDAD